MQTLDEKIRKQIIETTVSETTKLYVGKILL